MFKQLSQLGKNISDEISRGLNEDSPVSDSQSVSVQHDRNSPTNLYDDFPKDIQAKLRKFEKYEQKYPLLLNAYKLEKEKADDVVKLLKVLSENTPFSTLGEAAGLKDYFEDLNKKTVLLNDEIKRLTGENIAKGRQVEELELKLAQTVEAVDIAQEFDKRLSEKEQDYGQEIEKLKKEQNTLRDRTNTEVEQLQVALRAANSKCEELGSKFDAQCKDLRQAEKLIDSYKKTIQELSLSNSCSLSTVSESTMKQKGGKGRKNRGKKRASLTAGEESSEATSPDISADLLDSINTKVKYEQLLEDYERLSARYDDDKNWEKQYQEVNARLALLQDNLVTAKKEVKIKNEELETLRDMLRTVGNELVEAKDNLKDNMATSEDLQKLKDKLNAVSEEKDKAINSHIQESSTLRERNSALEKRLEAQLQKEEQQQMELKKIQENAKQLKQQNIELSDKLRDHTSLKRAESSSKLALTQKDKTIAYLEQQIRDYNTQGLDAQKTLNELRLEKEKLLKKVEILTKDVEKTKLESKKNDSNLENYIKENGKLSERLEVLQEKYDTLQNLKSNSNDQVDSIRRQCEELTLKLRESSRKIIALEDELNENSNILQDRTREANAMRRLLNENQLEKDSILTATEERLANVIDERDKLKYELELRVSSDTRELQELRKANLDLTSRIHNLTLKETELQDEIQQLRSLNQTIHRRSSAASEGSSELENVIKNLKGALGVSQQHLRKSKDTNQELKTLNDELNKKLERLSKNQQLLSGQLRMKDAKMSAMKTRSGSVSSQVSASGSPIVSPRTSPAVPSSNTTTLVSSELAMNEKIAYIKNVLLGFLEYREQRNQLLPVVSTLLHLDSNDEKRLLMSLK